MDDKEKLEQSESAGWKPQRTATSGSCVSFGDTGT